MFVQLTRARDGQEGEPAGHRVTTHRGGAATREVCVPSNTYSAMSNCFRILAFVAVLIACNRSATAQCAEWGLEFHSPGVSNADSTAEVKALTVWDDGSGSAIFVGGYFDYAGPIAAKNIAKWNGT